MRGDARALAAFIEGGPGPLDLAIDVRGSQFQRRVWAALSTISRGQTRSYGEIARQVGVPGGARAVAGACAANPLAVLIPCHRVVPGKGGTGGYRWGTERKRILLERERADLAQAVAQR